MVHSFTIKYLATVLILVGLVLASGCVSQKKYNQTSQALSRMDSLYFECQRETRQLEASIEELQEDTAMYSQEVRELIYRFNTMSQSSSERVKDLQEENAELQRKLEGYRITVSRYTIDWRNLKDDLMKSDSILAVFSYRLDTLLANSPIPYQIIRKPSALVLNLPEEHVFKGGTRLNVGADSTMFKVIRLMKAYPGLKIQTATKELQDADKLKAFTDFFASDSLVQSTGYRIDPDMMEDNYSLIFTVGETWRLEE